MKQWHVILPIVLVLFGVRETHHWWLLFQVADTRPFFEPRSNVSSIHINVIRQINWYFQCSLLMWIWTWTINQSYPHNGLFFSLFCFLESAGLKHWPQVNSILCAPPEDFSHSFLPLRLFFDFVFQISKEAQDFIVEQYKHLRERDATSKPH